QQMERAVKKRTAGADAATEKAGSVEAELAEARVELAAAIAARDAALADRAEPHGGAFDVERVRALLHEALAATRGPVASGRRKQRKPIAVPGGLYGNSEAAAEHLLRTSDVVVLVDGYNVAKLGWPGLTLEQQRDRCIEACENIARRWGTLLHVIFDGATVVGARASGRRLVRVSYSPDGVIADDVLRAEVAALEVDRPVVVVTNDQAVVTDIRAAGANSLSSDAFLAVARR
ncbi:MAG: NYN domain-containing protein, partial [Ilumatobacteraceae bacterium]